VGSPPRRVIPCFLASSSNLTEPLLSELCLSTFEKKKTTTMGG
jgi:hypothetical protein